VEPGYYTSNPGAFSQNPCVPGTFSSKFGGVACSSCPAGYVCSKFALAQPELCPRGYYRSLGDSISCKACPVGKYSPVAGLSDGDLCQPCPEGFVCSKEGIGSLQEAQLCFEGYVCGEGTGRDTRLENPCAAGFACAEGVTPGIQNSTVCPPGYYCNAGTKYSDLRLRLCPEGYYCPRGTSLIGTNPVRLFVNCLGDNSVNGEPCGVTNWTETFTLPGGVLETRDFCQCPRGTVSFNASKIEDCYPERIGEVLHSFSPFDLSQSLPVTLGNGNDHNATTNFSEAILLEQSFSLDTLDYLLISFNWTALDARMLYGQHFDVRLWINDQRYDHLPLAFTDSSVDQHQMLELSLLATKPGKFNLSMNIVHGLHLKNAQQFVDSATMALRRPNRALLNTSHSFVAIYDNAERDLAEPVNLPFEYEMESSMLLGSIVRSDSSPLLSDPVRDFALEDANDLYVLPFIPFFSNCRGYDSHIPLFDVLENPEHCDLIPESQTSAIHSFGIGVTPVSDTCELELQCIIEEDVEAVTSYPRWFDKNANEATAFYLSANPMTREVIEQADPDFFQALIESDDSIPVIVERDPNAPQGAIPRRVELQISYQQVTKRQKRIIAATISMDEFDEDLSNLGYSLTVTFNPLDYLGLVNAFAFSNTIYSVLYCIIGVLAVVVILVYWVLHRIFTRLKVPTRFMLQSFYRLAVGPAMLGMIMACGPVCGGLFVLYAVVVQWGLLDKFAGSWHDFGSSSLSASKVEHWRSGRIGVAFIAASFYLMVLGSHLLIPKRNKKSISAFQHLGTSTGHFAPKQWKRTNYMLLTLAMVGINILMIEFSFSSTFQDYVWEFVVLIKLSGGILENILVWMLDESLLTIPLRCNTELTAFVLTMGAEDFTDFVLAWAVDFSLLLIERVHWDKTLDSGTELARKGLRYCLVYLFRSVVDDEDDERAKAKPQPTTEPQAQEQALQAPGAATKEEEEKKKVMGRRRSSVVSNKYLSQPSGASTDKLPALTGLKEMAKKNLEKLEGDTETTRKSELAQKILSRNDTTLGIYRGIMDVMSDFTVDTLQLYIAPVFMASLILFRDESGIPAKYEIRQADMPLYILFAVMIIPFQTFMDIVFLNVQQIWHGYRLVPYLTYSAAKFNHRKERWILHEFESLDRSLPPVYRSIDQLCFSSQYYFVVLIHLVGMAMCMVGFECVFNNGFNLFQDAMSPVVIAGVLLFCRVTQLVCVEAALVLGIWSPETRRARREAVLPLLDLDEDRKKAKAAQEELIAEREYLRQMGFVGGWSAGYKIKVDNYRALGFANDLQRYSDEVFRFRFMKHNKDWLKEQINNTFLLQDLFDKQNIKKAMQLFPNGTLLTYLANFLMLDPEEPVDGAHPDGIADEMAAGAEGMIVAGVAGGGRLFKRAPKALSFDEKEEEEPEISITQIGDDPDQLPEVDLTPSLIAQSKLWLRVIRFRRALRLLAVAHADHFLRTHCELCRSTMDLAVHCTKPVEALIEAYELMPRGDKQLPNIRQLINVQDWLSYFASQQRFRTLCSLCGARSFPISVNPPLPLPGVPDHVESEDLSVSSSLSEPVRHVSSSRSRSLPDRTQPSLPSPHQSSDSLPTLSDSPSPSSARVTDPDDIEHSTAVMVREWLQMARRRMSAREEQAERDAVYATPGPASPRFPRSASLYQY